MSAKEKDSRFVLLPGYIAIDSSAGMMGEPFEACFSVIPRVLELLSQSVVVVEQALVEIITFDEKATVIFPLGNLQELNGWLYECKRDPIAPNGGVCKYGSAFKLLRDRVEESILGIRSQSYKVYRPVVFFISNGLPNEEKNQAEFYFNELISDNFKFRPNIVGISYGNGAFLTL
jgi:uncharacterized protein YegL